MAGARIRWILGISLACNLIGLGLVSRHALLPRVNMQMRTQYTDPEMARVAAQVTVDKDLPAGATLFIGDSLMRNLPAREVADGLAINYGINADTTTGMLSRMRQYPSLPAARAVVLEGGINDLRAGKHVAEITHNWEEMVLAVPPAVPLVICAVLPVEPRSADVIPGDIRALNGVLAALCRARKRSTFVDATVQFTDSTGHLRHELYSRDGIHLNAAGYHAWGAAIRRSLTEISHNHR